MRTIIRIAFIVVSTGILAWGHYYLWNKLVRETKLEGWLKRVTAFVFCTGFILIPSTMALTRFIPRGRLSPFAVPAFLWMGILAYLMMFVVGFDWMKRLYFKFRPQNDSAAPAPSQEATENNTALDGAPDPDRRLFLARAGATTALASTAVLTTYGVNSAINDIQEPVINVKLPRLPKALDGYKIVQLSDIHIGSVLGGDFIDYIVEQTNAMKPDLVAITGDMVDAPVSLIGPDIARLTKLKSRHGTYFVTGNHEYYANASEWVPFLRKIGMKVLINERVSIGDNAASFDLVGLPDDRAGIFYENHTPDLSSALKDRDPEKELVLLAHRPTAVKWAEQHDVGLQLSGHTHGGQFYPLEHVVQLLFPYVAGLHRHNEMTQVYVSRGTGFWGPPMRVGSPPEITSIVLSA